MKILLLSRSAHAERLLHQTPHGAGRYGDCLFVANDLNVRPDLTVVRHSLFKR